MPTEQAYFHLLQLREDEIKMDLSAIPDDFIQLEASREPLLTWAAKTPAHHPMDYPVPSYGADPDIENSLKQSSALKFEGEKYEDLSFDEKKDLFHTDKKFKLWPSMKYPATEEFNE